MRWQTELGSMYEEEETSGDWEAPATRFDSLHLAVTVSPYLTNTPTLQHSPEKANVDSPPPELMTSKLLVFKEVEKVTAELVHKK